jgi:Zn-dependent M28 family amino/carboxypeptidase
VGISRRLLLPIVALAVLAAAQAGASNPGQGGPGTRLANALDFDRIRADLAAFQRIADANGGTRAAGTPGYAASVRYVRGQLARAGYRARVLSFPFVAYWETVERARQLAPESRSLRVEAIDYSPSTPPGGVRGRVVAVDDGCEAGDYPDVRGDIVLARRGACFIALKARNAGAAGAIALIVFNVEPGPLDATLGLPGAAAIPVVAVEGSIAESLQAGENVAVELTVRTRTRRTTSQNVVVDARPAPRSVLLAGAHLDSVIAGPGINDNGTGVAVLLEIARSLRRLPQTPAVRLAFWGAEEFGLIGSSAYARSADLDWIAAYLNFDMLGSRTNHRVRLVYAGPFAAPWLEYFERRGLRASSTDLSGRSDHAPFAQAGIPIGGLFAGIDRCYHARCDRLASVDFALLRELAAAAAFGVAEFAPRG